MCVPHSPAELRAGFSGCCWGNATSLPWNIFPSLCCSSPAFHKPPQRGRRKRGKKKTSKWIVCVPSLAAPQPWQAQRSQAGLLSAASDSFIIIWGSWNCKTTRRGVRIQPSLLILHQDLFVLGWHIWVVPLAPALLYLFAASVISRPFWGSNQNIGKISWFIFKTNYKPENCDLPALNQRLLETTQRHPVCFRFQGSPWADGKREGNPIETKGEVETFRRY